MFVTCLEKLIRRTQTQQMYQSHTSGMGLNILFYGRDSYVQSCINSQQKRFFSLSKECGYLRKEQSDTPMTSLGFGNHV